MTDRESGISLEVTATKSYNFIVVVYLTLHKYFRYKMHFICLCNLTSKC